MPQGHIESPTFFPQILKADIGNRLLYLSTLLSPVGDFLLHSPSEEAPLGESLHLRGELAKKGGGGQRLSKEKLQSVKLKLNILDI